MKLEIPEKFAVLFPVEFGGAYRPSAFKAAKSGRAGLKTWQFARALLLHGIVHPIRVFCGRETLTSIKQSVLHELEMQRNLLGLQNEYEVGKTEINGTNGTTFIFGGLRVDPEALKSMGHIDFSWLEEASGITQASLDIFLPTVLRTPGSEVWFSYNPENDDDPVHKRFADDPAKPGVSKDPDCILINSSWEDAQAMGVLTPQMVKEKDKAYATDPENAAHVWGGETRKRNVAAIFVDKVLVKEFTPTSDWIGPRFGADWGFSSDPAVLTKSWAWNDCLYIEEEAFGVGVDTPHLPTLFSHVTGWWRNEIDPRTHKILTTKIPLPNVKIISDCSDPRLIQDMVARSVPCVACKKWPGFIEQGITALRAFKHIVIHPRCKRMIEEAKRYRYKTDKSTGAVLPIVVDADNHGWDSIRYAWQDTIAETENTHVVVNDTVVTGGVTIAPELNKVDSFVMPDFAVLNGIGRW